VQTGAPAHPSTERKRSQAFYLVGLDERELVAGEMAWYETGGQTYARTGKMQHSYFMRLHLHLYNCLKDLISQLSQQETW